MAPLSVLACDRDCVGPIWAFAGLGLYCLCVFFFFGSCAASRLGLPLGHATLRHLTSTGSGSVAWLETRMAQWREIRAVHKARHSA